jgi:guanyl-specific ribonuclease Sa
MPPRGSTTLNRQFWKLALAIIVMASMYVAARNGWLPEERPAERGPTATATTPEAVDEVGETVVQDVTIYDLDGEVAYEGDVDLAQTLARIAAGKRLSSHRNDGAEFQNRERRLPKRPAGYYREWVHPTPGLGGPGPQRIVTGGEGEIYYTPDHYRTFERLDDRPAD